MPITKRKRANEGDKMEEKEEEEEEKVENEDDGDDCADLDGHGRGVSVTAGGKKRVLTRSAANALR